jgi:uncharacterized membrane protein YccC
VTAPVALQLAGFAVLIAATAVWNPVAGLALLGAVLLLVGIVQERAGPSG